MKSLTNLKTCCLILGTSGSELCEKYINILTNSYDRRGRLVFYWNLGSHLITTIENGDF